MASLYMPDGRRESKSLSFVAERDEGVDFRGAPRGDVAGEEGDDEGAEGDCYEGQQVRRADAE